MTTGIRAGASASEVQLAVIPEAAWGVTPVSPAFQNMRMTAETLQPAKTTVRSNEIRADRNVVDEIMVGRAVAGNLSFELSYGTFDRFLESLFYSTWSTNVLENGSQDGTSLTAERKVELPSGAFEYSRFVGLVANTMTLNINSGAIVTGEFGMMGKYGGRGTTALAGATYTQQSTSRILNAVNHFAQLHVAGLSPAPRIKGLTLNITNNIRRQDEVGNLDSAGLAPGRFEVTGTINAYFENGNMLQAFLDHEDLSLSFVLGDASGMRYRFTLPTIILTGEPGGNATSNDDDVMQNIAFTAVLDRLSSPLLGCTLQIERGV